MRKPYQNKWWYVEGPHFPYILLLGWPFLWVWGSVLDLLDRRRERIYVKRGPMGEPVPVELIPDGPPYIIGKDFYMGERFPPFTKPACIVSPIAGTVKIAANGRAETLPYDAPVEEIRAAVDRLFGRPATWIKIVGEVDE